MVTAHTLLEDLKARGARVIVRGERLRVEAPQGALPWGLRQAVREQKAQLLSLVRGSRPERGAGLEDASIVEKRDAFAAVRIRSPRYGDVWLARDAAVAAKIAAEGHGLPVLTFEDVAALKGAGPETLRATLEVKAVFPEALVSRST